MVFALALGFILLDGSNMRSWVVSVCHYQKKAFPTSKPCGVGHITKNSANLFSACRKRRLKETGRGDWESPSLYEFSSETT